jgi:hypothetical protein
VLDWYLREWLKATGTSQADLVRLTDYPRSAGSTAARIAISSRTACVRWRRSATSAAFPFTDHPPCVSPVIAGFMRNWNDSLPDAERGILIPLLPKLIDTVNPEARRAPLADVRRLADPGSHASMAKARRADRQRRRA